MQIFLARDNKQAGPYTLEQLNTMLTSGQVLLTDLAWHEGMEAWLPLNQITGGQLYYTGTPHVGPLPDSSTLSPHTTPSSVAASGSQAAETPLELASVGKRIAAVLIDQLVFALCFLPAIPYINVSTADIENIKNPEQMMAFYEKTLSGVPATAQGFLLISMLLLIILQVFLLVKRGQTLGKLLFNIRIIDINHHKIPSVTNVLLLRTLAINIAYNLPFVGPIIFFADMAMLFFAHENRTLHDQLAKTKVVMAQDNQLDKPST